MPVAARCVFSVFVLPLARGATACFHGVLNKFNFIYLLNNSPSTCLRRFLPSKKHRLQKNDRLRGFDCSRSYACRMIFIVGKIGGSQRFDYLQSYLKRFFVSCEFCFAKPLRKHSFCLPANVLTVGIIRLSQSPDCVWVGLPKSFVCRSLSGRKGFGSLQKA